jgi:hypothetical protein
MFTLDDFVRGNIFVTFNNRETKIQDMMKFLEACEEYEIRWVTTELATTWRYPENITPNENRIGYFIYSKKSIDNCDGLFWRDDRMDDSHGFPEYIRIPYEEFIFPRAHMIFSQEEFLSLIE